MEWLPIETAPKDGTEVDLWTVFKDGDGERVTNAKWVDGPWPGWRAQEWDHGGMGWDPIWGEATHWMPLPKPPVREAKAA